jgi:hypothetical protein
MHTLNENIAFATDPVRWPVWPQLPLVHRDGRLGRLISTSLSDDGVRPIVYLGNIFRPLDVTEYEQYADFEQLFDSGWEID